MRQILAALMILLTAASAAPGPVAEQVDGDGGTSPFYRWTAPVPAAGRMLREEPAPEQALPEAAPVRRILYSSTSGVERGAIAVSGLLYLPKGRAPAGGWPVVAWSHGTVGVADVCAPSWAGPSTRDAAYLGRWLGAGFAVVATDYEGLGTPGMHPYLLWRSEGRSVLDAARAAIAARPGAIANRVLIVGQSQGSGAAIGATYLAPSYAPDLHVLGTVATGLVMTIAERKGTGYLGKDAALTDPTKMDGAFAMLRVGGIDRALHPDIDPATIVTPKGRPMLTAARTACLHDMFALAKQRGITGANSFTAGVKAYDADMEPAFQIPAAALTVPVLAGTGLADSMAGTSGQYDAVKALCAAGSRIQWHTYPGLSHGGAVNGSLVDSLPFARALLAGRPVADSCKTLQPPGPVQTPRAGVPFQ
nr:lipase family protein [Sphingomonas populi]